MTKTSVSDCVECSRINVAQLGSCPIVLAVLSRQPLCLANFLYLLHSYGPILYISWWYLRCL